MISIYLIGIGVSLIVLNLPSVQTLEMLCVMRDSPGYSMKTYRFVMFLASIIYSVLWPIALLIELIWRYA
jgi:hypothetical protein